MLRDRGLEVLCQAVINHESLEHLNISQNKKSIILSRVKVSDI